MVVNWLEAGTEEYGTRAVFSYCQRPDGLIVRKEVRQCDLKIRCAFTPVGRAASLLFAREGAKVIVAESLAKEGQETVDLVNKAGGEATFVQLNASIAAKVKRMANSVTQKYGKVNVLYNNAGIYLPQEDSMIAELAEEVWDEVINVNLKCTYPCFKYVIRELIECGGRSIINVSSIAGLVASESPAYWASKGG
jgi:NAD(P)-dependent dehydrogenase (short-subunit alcohol dehydrogenase family)